MIEFLKEKDFETTINSKIPVLIEFWTFECLACEIAQPFLLELEKGYLNKLKIFKVDTSRCPEIMKKYKIHIWPTFILYKEGMVVMETVGFRNGIELEKKIRNCL